MARFARDFFEFGYCYLNECFLDCRKPPTELMKYFLPCILFLTSCTVLEKPYVEPAEVLIKKFSDIRPAENFPSSMSLEEAKALALSRNPGVQAAKARILSARARLLQSYSTYFPQLSLNLSANHTADTSVDTTNGVRRPSFETYSAATRVSWLLFDGFNREYTVLSERYNHHSAKEQYEDAQRLLIRAVARAYYSALLSREQVRLSEEDIKRNQAFLEEAEKRFQGGAGTEIDVLNFRIRANNAKIVKVDAARDYEISLLVLLELMGVRPESVKDKWTLTEDLSMKSSPEPGISESLRAALARRPDLRSLQADMLSSGALVKAAEGAFYPRFSAQASAGFTSLDKVNFQREHHDRQIGVSVDWDLFTGGRRRHAVSELKALVKVRDRDLANQWNGVITEVVQEVYNIRGAVEKLRFQTKTVEDSRKLYTKVRESYDVGVERITRVNEVTSDLNFGRDQSSALSD